jgi:hypothetical protein
MGRLCRVDLELGNRQRILDVSTLLSTTERTYCRWPSRHRGMAPEMAKQLKSLLESARLKRCGEPGLGLADLEGSRSTRPVGRGPPNYSRSSGMGDS